MQLSLFADNDKRDEPVKACSRLCDAIGELCERELLTEKWIICPSIRIGRQWLDSVAASGRPVVNARITTLRHMALDIASDFIESKQLRLLPENAMTIIAGRIFCKLITTSKSYFSGMNVTPGLKQAIARTIKDLRMAGCTSEHMNEAAFEVRQKALDIGFILEEFEQELSRGGYIDGANLLRTAADLSNQSPNSPEKLFALPQGMLDNLAPLEKNFWNSLCESNRTVLETDQPEIPAEECKTDLSLLSYVQSPADAPTAFGDGSVRMWRATGAFNEARQVLRICASENIPLDDIEIICADAKQYSAIFWEMFAGIKKDTDGLSVTFSDGVSVRFSRAGKTLAGWVEWVRGNYNPALLARLISGGLLAFDVDGGASPGFSEAATVLRSLPIGPGISDYECRLKSEVKHAKARGKRQRMACCNTLLRLVERIVPTLPKDLQNASDILHSALRFLVEISRETNKSDEYSRQKICEEIDSMRLLLTAPDDMTGQEALDWLEEIARTLHIGGEGPRPGCAYVSGINSGGHSGRRHTFFLGMNDSAFPPGSGQDPLLLDGERSRLDDRLKTSADARTSAMRDFALLLSRIRGKSFFSYSCVNLEDGSESFPANILLSVYRIISGNSNGDQGELTKYMGDPASFAPLRSQECIDRDDWLLWRRFSVPHISNWDKVVFKTFPNLERGSVARVARSGDIFTPYDGFVPEMASDISVKESLSVSAQQLETMGRCPMEYFFRYILRISPPDEFATEPYKWLEANERGELLHSVFRKFMALMIEEKTRPQFERDYPRITEIFNREVEKYLSLHAPTNEDVYRSERDDLLRTVTIFLNEEIAYANSATPVCLEASFGLEAEGEGSPVDTDEPITLRLNDGQTIKARGRIDRVDRLTDDDGEKYVIWDYKTGSTYGYEANDPFRQGRKIQNTLYLLAAEKLLRENLSPKATVDEFGYFFPGTRSYGDRIKWSAEDLSSGVHVIEKLCAMIRSGVFPMTDSDADIFYSDYTDAFVDPEKAISDIKRKLGCGDNEALSAFMELRGYDDG